MLERHDAVNYLTGFFTLDSVFQLLRTYGHQQSIAIMAAAATFVLLSLQHLRDGFLISWTTLTFLVFMIVTVLYFRHPWLSDQAWIIANGSLAFVAWTSLLVKKPFTIQYAKREVEESKWKSPLFLKINIILTVVWGTVFTLCTFLHIVRGHSPTIPRWFIEISTDSLSIAAILFTAWFPNWYVKKISSDKP